MLASEGAFATRVSALTGNLVVMPRPFERWGPMLFLGAGVVGNTSAMPWALQGRYLQVQGGVGVQYRATQRLGVRSTIGYYQPFTDILDGKVAGQRNDYYLRGTLGLVVNLGRLRRPKVRSLTIPSAGNVPTPTDAPSTTPPKP